jgi:hypothetical protein
MQVAEKPVVTAEPPYLTFLKDLASQVVLRAKETNFVGRVVWNVTQVGPTRTGIEIRYDEEDRGTPYFMTLSKRFFDRNIVRISEVGDSREYVLEADADVVLRHITF